jgi:chemotaxis response regulator CheB
MKTVPSNDATLAAKICHILASASQPHSARLFISTEQQIQFVEEWCLRVFQTGNEMSLMQSLSALEMVLRGRAVTVSSEVKHIITILAKYKQHFLIDFDCSLVGE